MVRCKQSCAQRRRILLRNGGGRGPPFYDLDREDDDDPYGVDGVAHDAGEKRTS